MLARRWFSVEQHKEQSKGNVFELFDLPVSCQWETVDRKKKRRQGWMEKVKHRGIRNALLFPKNIVMILPFL